MKRIDKETEQKLYWLFTPMALVFVWMIVYLWFNVNLLEKWFGLDADVMKWGMPSMLISVAIICTGFGIAAIKQKCWGQLVVALVMIIFALLNMSNFFVDLI